MLLSINLRRLTTDSRGSSAQRTAPQSDRLLSFAWRVYTGQEGTALDQQEDRRLAMFYGRTAGGKVALLCRLRLVGWWMSRAHRARFTSREVCDTRRDPARKDEDQPVLL